MADLTVTRCGPFGTFDLASAYADAEQVKWMQQRRRMLAQSAQQDQQQQQDLAHAQQTWAELQASQSNPAWRKQNADRVRAEAPQLASATDDEVVRFAEVGIAQKLGIEDEESISAPTTRTIYQGDVAVQQEFDPVTRAWTDVGRGERWQPKPRPTPPSRR